MMWQGTECIIYREFLGHYFGSIGGPNSLVFFLSILPRKWWPSASALFMLLLTTVGLGGDIMISGCTSGCATVEYYPCVNTYFAW